MSGTVPQLDEAFPAVTPPKDDPAYQHPRAPTAEDMAKRANVILREIPLTTTATAWTVPAVRYALAQGVVGQFDWPAQLCDAIVGDGRVQAALGSRTSSLLGRPVAFEESDVARVRGSRAARECLDAWAEAWPALSQEATIGEMHQWGVLLGLGPAQILWDTSRPVWQPHLRTFHPRYTWFHPVFRKLIAITLDGLVPISPGDGGWVLHAPHGQPGNARGWMRGAMRALAQPWIYRQLAMRDLARYSERHGFPIVLGKRPAAAKIGDITNWNGQLSRLGQESVVDLPQGVDETNSYSLEYLEASDSTWEVFIKEIETYNTEITLAIQYQNLTTEVTEGSFAAARIHGGVKQAAVEFDERSLARTIYQQIARIFAAINFGDADLAPFTHWQVTPYEDNSQAAKTLLDFTSALKTMREAGYKVKDPAALARTFDLHLQAGDIELADPILPGGAPPDKPKEEAKEAPKGANDDDQAAE